MDRTGAIKLQADNYVKKAEKQLKSWFSPKEEKNEKAMELFQQAGNQYKLLKEWESAAKAFEKAAECVKQTDQESAFMSSYLYNAAGCYRKTDSKKAVKCLVAASEIAQNAGRFIQAAKYYKEAAEVLDEEADFGSAIKYYKMASDLYDVENESSPKIICLLRIAHLLSSDYLRQYNDAIPIYEKLAFSAIDNNLLKWKVKDHLMRAILCWLALDDIVGAKRAIDKYCDMDYSFSKSREYQFMLNIYESIVTNDIVAFTDVIVKYDGVTTLDPWKTSILLFIKNNSLTSSIHLEEVSQGSEIVESNQMIDTKKADAVEEENSSRSSDICDDDEMLT